MHTPRNHVGIFCYAQLVIHLMFVSCVFAQFPSRVLYGGKTSAAMGSIAGGFDMNGDGSKDIVVGSFGTGKVTIYRSDASVIATIIIGTGSPGFGYSIALPGDINGDGHNDLLIGNPGLTGCTTSTAGYVKAYLGPAFTTTAYTVTGGSGDAFSRSLAVVGDTNNDGVKDFIVGIPRALRQGNLCSLTKGKAEVRSGATGSLLKSYSGTTFGQGFGGVVGNVGDVNNDGRDDFAVSTLLALNGFTHVYSGNGYSKIHDIAIAATIANAGGLSRLDDVNGDSKDDFIIGAPQAKTVYIISGANKSVLYSVTESSLTNFGISTATIGDANNDGINDFAISSANPGGTGAGVIKILSGANGATISTMATPQSMPTANNYAEFLSAIGDINSDGLIDFAAGASADSQGFATEGSVRLYLSPSGLPYDPESGRYWNINGTVVRF